MKKLFFIAILALVNKFSFVKSYEIDITTRFSPMVILENIPDNANLEDIKSHLKNSSELNSILTQNQKNNYWTTFDDVHYKIMFNGHELTAEDISSGNLKSSRKILIVKK